MATSNLHSSDTRPSSTADGLEWIVRRCQAGNADARRLLYEACHENVFRLVVRMVGLQDAADVTQQVFLQAFRTIDQFARESQFTTRLYRLTVNEALQFLRRERRHRLPSVPREYMDRSPQFDDDAEQRELMEQALGRLGPELRAIFVLREVDKLTYHEIATVLQIAEGTVGSRLNRARAQLRAILLELGWEP